jgi:hypothetical protein
MILTWCSYDVRTVKGRGKEAVKPTSVLDYNQCLGGVDLEDQLLHSYLIERKRMDMLYIKLLHRLLNKIPNSLMIYRNNVAKIIDQLSLRIKLVEELFVKYAMC